MNLTRPGGPGHFSVNAFVRPADPSPDRMIELCVNETVSKDVIHVEGNLELEFKDPPI